MGLFNKLGQKVERFRQDAKQAAAETEQYYCEDCEARFHTDYEECPECGSTDVSTLSDAE
jgi:rRNA maturation endonuclease Nob1